MDYTELYAQKKDDRRAGRCFGQERRLGGLWLVP